MIKRYFFLILLLIIIHQGCSMAQNSGSVKKAPDPASYYRMLPVKERSFLDTLQRRSFYYFLGETSSQTGLVKDRSTNDSPASIAAAGFAVCTWAVGAENKWITREDAAMRTLQLLRFLVSSEQGTDPLATGYMGFYYHFLKMDNGQREWNCELSSVDTAWLLAGIIFARQYYDRGNSTESEIRALAGRVLGRVDWNWMVLKYGKDKGLISMGWTPEKGFHEMGWEGYNEGLYIYIIAAGMGLENPREAYDRWLKPYRIMEPYPGLKHVAFPPMFGHQYSHMFVDFRGLYDKKMKELGFDYFENSRRATYVQRLYAVENPRQWAGYDSLTWGLSACDGPGDRYDSGDKKFLYYSARGTSGDDHIWDDDGTIAPTAAGGSVVFAPEICIPALLNMYEKYGHRGLWSKYGLKDSFNPTVDWYAADYLGIDQGPIVIMIENMKNSLIWKYSMKDPIIQEGLRKLEIKK